MDTACVGGLVFSAKSRPVSTKAGFDIIAASA